MMLTYVDVHRIAVEVFPEAQVLGDGGLEVGASAELDAGGVVLEQDRQLGARHPMHGIEFLGLA
jgi:hypothetical protein